MVHRFAGAIWAALASLLLCSSASSQEELQRVYADPEVNLLGWSVSDAGDVNGDGVPDTVMSGWMKRDGTEFGRALVYSGVSGDLLHRLHGGMPLGRFGWSCAGAGDVNDDGFDDLIVGAPLAGIASLVEAGRVTVFSGLDGSQLYRLNGDDAFDQFGYAVDGVGDVDADGFADFVAGAPGAIAGGSRGIAQVHSGRTGEVLHRFRGKAGARLGSAVAGAGDVDGDGTPDVIVGSPTFDGAAGAGCGRALVFSGATGDKLLGFQGDAAGDQMGTAVDGAGDVNGDGRADLIVGAPGVDQGEPNFGLARVFSGLDGSVLYNLLGDKRRELFGSAVSGAGDVNGDGFADVLVGAPRRNSSDTNAGAARLVSGATGGTLFDFLGNSADDQFGYSVSGAGDLDGDGFDEVLIGAPYDASIPGTLFELPDAGEVVVYGGNDLYLHSPAFAADPGDTLTLTTLEGTPGNLTMLFVVNIDGSPCFCQVLGVGFFDGNGQRVISGPVPSDLSGLDLGFQAFAQADAGAPLDSAVLTIEFH